MFYSACWGSTLLERMFLRLMRRFAHQTGFAIFSMLLVSFISAHAAGAQDAQPDSPRPKRSLRLRKTRVRPRSKPAPTVRLLLPQRQPNPNRATC